jgi:hypothetical protein
MTRESAGHQMLNGQECEYRSNAECDWTPCRYYDGRFEWQNYSGGWVSCSPHQGLPTGEWRKRESEVADLGPPPPPPAEGCEWWRVDERGGDIYVFRPEEDRSFCLFSHLANDPHFTGVALWRNLNGHAWQGTSDGSLRRHGRWPDLVEMRKA